MKGTKKRRGSTEAAAQIRSSIAKSNDSDALRQDNSEIGKSDSLLPHHRKMLEDSGISADVRQARGYRSVKTRAELRRLGFGDSQQRVPALLLPVWGVAGIVQYQSRPDEPRMNKAGKMVKYETRFGTAMRLDIPPMIRSKVRDPAVPLFITEGIKKADSAVSKGLCCVALLGVWNFRGTNEYGGKTALPEWEYIALNGRQTYIVFDSDVMTKPEVHAALVRFKALLESQGAKGMPIYLPSSPGGVKVGLDDFLASGKSVDDLLSLASTIVRKPVVDENEASSTGPYEATEAGLVHNRRTSDGPISVPLTNFQARIVTDVSEDDGVEVRKALEIEALLDRHEFRFTVPAMQFPSMAWVTEKLGAHAIVYAGLGIRDHVRVAIQCLSSDMRSRSVYAHTGWRKLGDLWAYLHAGGAIGPEGPLKSVEVSLHRNLSAFILPDPPTGESIIEATQASLSLLEVAPDCVTAPLLAAIYSAPLGSTDFSLHLHGPTGVFKSELAALAQQHFGAGLDSRNLPASWSSTANSLEALAFVAKDALIVVDDFSPTGSVQDLSRYHREADRLLRAQGNHSGRQRMRADGTLAVPKPPRGLIVSTGEDVPRGQSLRARALAVEVHVNDVNVDRLTVCQGRARDGDYARSMSGYLRWLAVRYDSIRAKLRANVEALRVEATKDHQHRRTPDITATLMNGFRTFLNFAHDSGAITDERAEVLDARVWVALGVVANAQREQQKDSEPTGKFLRLLISAITSGAAHVAGVTGREPDNSNAWGWREFTVGVGEHERVEWRPQGTRIGWVDGDELLLEFESAYAVAQKLASASGDSIGVTVQTLKRRLHEKGLVKVEMRGDETRLEARRTVENARRSVVILNADMVCPREESAQAAQSLHGGRSYR